ncbi:MAG: hypothetical protein CL609_20865 [Anaerolineaceae bacterium]|nr:hypothetical protein [Anaerolineaceae bacterium]
MKKTIHLLLGLILMTAIILTAIGSQPVKAQTETPVTPTESATATPTQPVETATPTQPAETPTPTTQPTETTAPTTAPFARPLVVIDSYNTGDDSISMGDGFNLNVRLKNTGRGAAYNVVANFQSTEFSPLETGGVKAVATIDASGAVDIRQPMKAHTDLWGVTSGTVTVALSYTDSAGTAYTENFSITIAIKQPDYSSWAATATPTPKPRAQLVVAGYTVDADPLQPGTIFNLDIEVRNLGSTTAKNVTMVLGGGVVQTSNGDGNDGTPSGGVSGGGAELTNFAPLGSSNLIFIPEVPVGENVKSSAQLIVNVSSNPGAYPFKLSFVYNDENGNRVVDDQVITLLVYSLPRVEVGFYRDPGILMTGQPGPLPLQITNLGKTTAVLGNMKVTADGVEIMENVSLVGALEPGGYFTMDAMVIPFQAGPLELNVQVGYTDDFNQPRMIEQKVVVQVEEMPVFEPPPEGEMDPGMEGPGYPMPGQPETFGQKLLRAIKGLLGLGSAQPQPVMEPMPMPDEMYNESPPQKPVIVGPKG